MLDLSIVVLMHREISRSDGEFTIKSRPVKLNLDTYEARNSVTPTLRQSISNAAQKGQEMLIALLYSCEKDN
ncbi:MAG: DUF6470 family protein [[Clostridium] nexile]